MMKMLLFLLSFLSCYGQVAHTLKDSELNPLIERPLIPGTQTPLEEMNTSPNTPPGQYHSDKFRGTLLNPSFEEKEKMKEKKKPITPK